MNEPPLSFFVDLTFRLFLYTRRTRSLPARRTQATGQGNVQDPGPPLLRARGAPLRAWRARGGLSAHGRPALGGGGATHGLLCFVSSSPVGRQDLFLGLGHRLALGARGQAPLLGALHVVAGHAGGGKGEGERERREREGDEQGRVGWSESERVREQRGAFSRESPNPGACRPQSAPRSRSCKTPGTACATVHWAGQASPAGERGGGGAVRRTTRG